MVSPFEQTLITQKKLKIRAPTVMENPGKKSWSWKVMEKTEFHGNLFAWKKFMEISCPNPPNRVPIVL